MSVSGQIANSRHSARVRPVFSARMVKKLDLLESNHGCGLNALSRESIQTERNTTLHGPDLMRNVFPQPFGA